MHGPHRQCRGRRPVSRFVLKKDGQGRGDAASHDLAVHRAVHESQLAVFFRVARCQTCFLQVCGLDEPRDNMQGLERSVNRSVDAQMRNPGRRSVNPFSKTPHYDMRGAGTQITEFLEGASR